MAQFHFVDDYQQHVRTLLDTHSRDEAMSLAVGGEWDRLGEMLSDFVLDLGVSNGMRLLDFGCGSGRLAYYLKQKCELSGYVGLDVVDELLDYAREKVPTPEYVFQNNQSLSLPTDLGVFDVICSFSVFTHLLQTEIYLYLRAMEQSLVPGGQFIFSFIELDTHWPVFELSCEAHAHHGQPHPHLNQFLEKIIEKLKPGLKKIDLCVTISLNDISLLKYRSSFIKICYNFLSFQPIFENLWSKATG